MAVRERVSGILVTFVPYHTDKSMKKPFLLLLALCGMLSAARAQPSKKETQPTTVSHTPDSYRVDSVTIRSIYNEILRSGNGYRWLEDLCLNIGHRLSGSPAADKSVDWAKNLMEGLGLDAVILQPVMVPHWERGAPEEAFVTAAGQKTKLSLLALGNSTATDGTLNAQVVEVASLEALEALPAERVKGKIVFVNMPFNDAHVHSFTCYGETYVARRFGPGEASKKGAVACLVRSLTHAEDDFPHTGNTGFDTGVAPLPCAALGRKSADKLHEVLAADPKATVSLTLNCRTLPDKLSYNVIGEIRGSEKPGEYIMAGGHLDSWDVGQGAHDDGAGCVQALEMLRTFKVLGYKPRHSIRAVLFMNEENGLRGGKTYAEEAKKKNEMHLAAIESDAGGFTPRGFTFENNAKAGKALQSWRPLLEPYLLHRFWEGGSGADIGPLAKNGPVALFGYRPDEQRYFDYHHAPNDTFDKVNRRELDLGSAAITALVYLIDQHPW